jgi:hypothetical protein
VCRLPKQVTENRNRRLSDSFQVLVYKIPHSHCEQVKCLFSAAGHALNIALRQFIADFQHPVAVLILITRCGTCNIADAQHAACGRKQLVVYGMPDFDVGLAGASGLCIRMPMEAAPGR